MSFAMQIEKLGEDNYEVWCLSMKSVLVTADLWLVTCGKTIKPESNESAEKWDILDQKALACIVLNVKPSQLSHIKKCEHASEA
ncbi:hypothetical protein KR018_000390, partial [Drosophila ironensis]